MASAKTSPLKLRIEPERKKALRTATYLRAGKNANE